MRLSNIARQLSMAPTTAHYDYLVIGGGSGGVASARRAAKHGAKTLLIEGARMGGTCVNVGCVPKKVMWYASDLASRLGHAKAYNFSGVENVKFDWAGFKVKRDAYIKRLNGIYESNLNKEGVEYVYGWASFVDKKTVKVALREGGEQTFTADKILVASGGAPKIPDFPGAEHGITSDGFFELEQQPKKVAIIGAGYIAVELAGVFNGLGTETNLLIRHESVLRNFDSMIGDTLVEQYEKHGVKIHKNICVDKVEKDKVVLKDGTVIEADCIIWCIGRYPLSEHLNLEEVGVKLDKQGKVVVDEYQNTSVPNIYSVGDLAEDVELTPAAIAAGRRLSERLFNGKADSKLDYNNIPSAIFSHPEAASIGLSEQEAREKYDNVKVYKSKFINMYWSPFAQEDKEPCVYKLVVEGAAEKVVGLHLVGENSGEIMQGFGVAIKMGATKKDFDNCVAIHPTAAEEIVTLV